MDPGDRLICQSNAKESRTVWGLSPLRVTAVFVAIPHFVQRHVEQAQHSGLDRFGVVTLVLVRRRRSAKDLDRPHRQQARLGFRP
jgi:hypothetical protein